MSPYRACVGCLLLASLSLGAMQPGVVLVLIDDMSWHDPGFAGNPRKPTPNLDGLARRGMVFTQAYAAAPNCAPTRASLMTGQYPPRHGVFTVVDERHRPGRPEHRIIAADSRAELDTSAVTIAEVLRDAGYATGMVGMWNLGRGRRGPNTPTGQGFDRFVDPKELGFGPDGYWNAKHEYNSDRMTDAALEWIRAQTQPFFLYLAYHDVHGPYEPKSDLLTQFHGDAHAATLAALDENIGRLAAALPTNTFLLFTSDNGGEPDYVAPLRGGKGTLYEGGLRVPMLMCGPGIAAGASSDVPVSSIDLLPTLMEVAGVTRTDLTVDGRSLVPLWNGGDLDRDALHWHFPCYAGQGAPASALREGRYKLIEFFETDTVELYDLQADPGETHDLAREQPERAAKLRTRLAAWQKELGAPCPHEPNPSYDARMTRGRRKGRP